MVIWIREVTGSEQFRLLHKGHYHHEQLCVVCLSLSFSVSQLLSNTFAQMFNNVGSWVVQCDQIPFQWSPPEINILNSLLFTLPKTSVHILICPLPWVFSWTDIILQSQAFSLSNPQRSREMWVQKLIRKRAATQWAVSIPHVEKNYIRNMNMFVPKQKPNHIAGTVSRAFNLTAIICLPPNF